MKQNVFCKVYTYEQAVAFDKKYSGKPNEEYWREYFPRKKYIYAVLDFSGKNTFNIQSWMPPEDVMDGSRKWLIENGYKEVFLFDMYLSEAEKL